LRSLAIGLVQELLKQLAQIKWGDHQQRRGQGIIMTRPSRSPSPKISSVVSDVDGKLVTDQKLLTKRTKAAVAAQSRASESEPA
jgi:hypothetical protein